MTEITPLSHIPHHSEITEQNPHVARNIRLLTRAYIPNAPALAGEEEEVARHWLSKGERRGDGDNTIITSIGIRYDTQTGGIIKKPDFEKGDLKDGDVSILRTFLVSEGEKVVYNQKGKSWDTTAGTYKILLAYPKDWLNPHAMTAAVEEKYMGGDGIDPLESEGNWILPERIIPEDVREHGSNITGVMEPWGQSQFVEKPADMVMFRSVELFNQKHGPSLTSDLFKGMSIQEPEYKVAPRSILTMLSNLKNKFSPKK